MQVVNSSLLSAPLMDVDEERDEGCLDFVIVVMKCSGRKEKGIDVLRACVIRYDGAN